MPETSPTCGEQALAGIDTLRDVIPMDKDALVKWADDIEDPMKCVENFVAIILVLEPLVILLKITAATRPPKEKPDATTA